MYNSITAAKEKVFYLTQVFESVVLYVDFEKAIAPQRDRWLPRGTVVPIGVGARSGNRDRPSANRETPMQ
jgi:hypothetical protein